MTLRGLLGDDVDRELYAVFATVALGFAGVFSFVAYFAVWAVTDLGARPQEVGLAFTGAAAAGVAGAFVGGRLSDRVGRRPVIVVAAFAQTAAAALLLLPVGRAGAYAVLTALSFLQPLRGATQRALVADLARDSRLESAFGALRIAINLGGTGGPLVGAALLALGWPALHAGTVVFFALSAIVALRLPVSPPARATRMPLGRLFAGRLGIVLTAGVFAWIVYQAFETVLPVSLTSTHGVDPAVWGALFVVNPLLTVALQLRVTRWAGVLRADVRLALALALMGLPFLALSLGASLPLVVAIVVCVTMGEMLWAPTAEALVARSAPFEARGAALGAFTASSWLGTALGPAVTLQAGDRLGDTAMWLLVATAALVAAALYGVAARRSDTTAHDRDAPRLAGRKEAVGVDLA